MNEVVTTIKVSKELNDALTKRSELLGMTKAAYVDRLLRMGLCMHQHDAVKEFTALQQFVNIGL